MSGFVTDPGSPTYASGVLGDDEAWSLLRGLRKRSTHSEGPAAPFSPLDAITPMARRLLDLYLPLCAAHGHCLIVAHLAQSLDGCVATRTGESRYVTGEEDLRHTHRMRALFDVVLVGATTVAVDDPLLTTRLVPGDQPVRVVFDPRGRLAHDRRIFTDGVATTMVVVGEEHAHRHAALSPRVELLPFPLDDGRLPLARVVEALGSRGLFRIFVEGGGATVSRFIEAGLLDRLQIAVAPTLFRSAPAIDAVGVRGSWFGNRDHVRAFLLGRDILFDCDLQASEVQREAS